MKVAYCKSLWIDPVLNQGNTIRKRMPVKICILHGPVSGSAPMQHQRWSIPEWSRSHGGCQWSPLPLCVCHRPLLASRPVVSFDAGPMFGVLGSHAGGTETVVAERDSRESSLPRHVTTGDDRRASPPRVHLRIHQHHHFHIYNDSPLPPVLSTPSSESIRRHAAHTECMVLA